MEYYGILKKCTLFAGIAEQDLTALLTCLRANQKVVKRDESIFFTGSRAEYIGIVLEGSVYIHKEDCWGNRSILTVVQAGELFGEAFACAESDSIPISASARENSRILLIDCKRLMTNCSSVCSFHTNMVRNLLRIIAKKNIQITKKAELLAKKSVRDKVLQYLSECALAEGRSSFSIPFNRQELADYLSVERSALSNTLGKMRDEGIIKFEKNKFSLLQTQ